MPTTYLPDPNEGLGARISQLLLAMAEQRQQDEQLRIQRERLALDKKQADAAAQAQQEQKLQQQAGADQQLLAAAMSGMPQLQAMANPTLQSYANAQVPLPVSNANARALTTRPGPGVSSPLEAKRAEIGTQQFGTAKNLKELSEASLLNPDIDPNLLKAKIDEFQSAEQRNADEETFRRKLAMVDQALSTIPEKYRPALRNALYLRELKLLPEAEFDRVLEMSGVPLGAKDRASLALNDAQRREINDRIIRLGKEDVLRKEVADALGLQSDTVTDSVVTDFLRNSNPKLSQISPLEIAKQFALALVTKTDIFTGASLYTDEEALHKAEFATQVLTQDSTFKLGLFDADRREIQLGGFLKSLYDLRVSEGKSTKAIREEALRAFQQDYPNVDQKVFDRLWARVVTR